MTRRRTLAYLAAGVVAAEGIAFGSVLAWFWADWFRHVYRPRPPID